MTAYATREDVYLHGLPRGSLVGNARAIASVDVASNRIQVDGHGCSTGTPIQFACDEGGALPSPIAINVVYYARPVADSDSLLEIASTPTGSAIDLTSSGTGPARIVMTIAPLLDALCETYSRWVDSVCIGHYVPFASPYPAWVTHVVAVRTAAHAARVLGLGAQGERLFAAEESVISDAMRLGKGVPLRDANATAPANRAAYAVAKSAVDASKGTLP